MFSGMRLWNAFSYTKANCTVNWVIRVFPRILIKSLHFFYQKVGQFSETKGKSIFRFLVSEIWSLKLSRYTIHFFLFHPKRCALFWNGFSRFYLWMSFWVMVDFVFYLRSAFSTQTNLEFFLCKVREGAECRSLGQSWIVSWTVSTDALIN